MKTKKKILVLGGGSSQINLLKKCCSMNLHTILADINPQASGRNYSDDFVKVSTFDRDGVYKAAEKTGADAVITAGSDQPVYTASYAAEKLGLPLFISSDTALKVTNKLLMKQIFSDNRIKSAQYIFIDRNTNEKTISRLNPPYVLKPADSQGQRGVLKLDTPAEVKASLEYTLSFSREKTAVLEEYYDSDEITVSGWLLDSRLYIFSVTDRVTFENLPAIGICSSHQYPSPYAESFRSEIISLTEKIVSAFQLENGPLYFQYLAGENGIYVNEIACRLGGAYEDELLPHITGIDTAQLLIKASLGEKISKADFNSIKQSEISFKGTWATVMLMFAKPGIIKSFKTPWADKSSKTSLKIFKYIIQKDTEILPVANSTQRAGYAIICSSNPDNLVSDVKDIIHSSAVYDSEGNDLLFKDVEGFIYKKRRRFSV